MDDSVGVVRAQDLGNVALKLVGLIWVFFAVMTLPSSLMLTPGFTLLSQALGTMGFEFTFLVLGVFLMRWSSSLSRRLFGSAAEVCIPLPVAAELQVVAFRVLGVCTLLNCLPSLVQILVEGTSRDLSYSTPSMIASLGTTAVLGSMLLLYRSSILTRLCESLIKKSQPRP